MSDNNKDAIRARIAAEEKSAARDTTLNRGTWWQTIAHVTMPKFGRRFGMSMMALAVGMGAYVGSGEFLGGVNNSAMTITPPDNGSAIVEMFSRSMTRELNTGWCPSSSYIFSPSHIRIDMCAFQEGKQEVYIRLANDLANHLTRQGYATRIDPDVSAIQQAFNRGNHWSITPWSSTYDQYRNGVKTLDALQQRLEQHNENDVAMHYRIENLAYLISNVASNVGSEQANLNGDNNGWFFGIMGSRSDYYHALGVMSGTCEVLTSVKTDFQEVLKLQSSTDIFNQAVDSSCATLGWGSPLIFNNIQRPALFGKVSTLAYDLQIVQNALAAQGMTNGGGYIRPVAPVPGRATPPQRAPR